MMVQQGQMGAPGGGGGGGQPGQQPGGPQMMGQQGFMMPNPNAPGGQPPQMFQPMYPAPTGQAPMRPPGGGQGQMPQGQGQQPMVFNQQGQQMAMPGNLVQVQGAQNQGGVNMANMPKFGGMGGQPMVMMVPQGFAPMPVQGQPNQP